MNLSKPISTRFLELDALRGLWVVSVMLTHYTTIFALSFPHLSRPLFYFPWLAYRIQFFCMISGFVIAKTVDKKTNVAEFIISRFLRLYPAYVVAVIVDLILIVLSTHSLQKTALLGALVNLTMLQAWFNVPLIDNSFWFLAPLVSFYALICLLLLFNKFQHIESIGMLGLIVMFFNYIHWPAFIVDSELLFFWHSFYAGIIFYYLKSRGDAWHRHAALALCFIVQNLISDDFTSVLSLAGCLILFYLFIYGKLKWIINKPLLFLGSISYCLFLINFNLGFFIIRKLYAFGAGAWLRLMVPVAISILVATIMTYWIELPVIAYVRKSFFSRS